MIDKTDFLISLRHSFFTNHSEAELHNTSTLEWTAFLLQRYKLPCNLLSVSFSTQKRFRIWGWSFF